MKFFLVVFLLIMLLTVNGVKAKELPFTTQILPKPLEDVYETFSKIEINPERFSFMNRSIENIRRTNLSVFNSIGEVEKLWNNTNGWFEDKIGVSLRKILIVIGNLFIWILELITKIMKFIIGLIS